MKKVLALALSLALIATLAISGTIAYLTDTDEAVNVMTLGNVDIEQIEQEYDGNGALVDFTQGKPLYPYVGKLGWENDEENGGAYRKFTMENVVDKYVSVKNTGKSDAYVRTIIALEQGTESPEVINNYMGISINAANGSEFKFEGAWIWDAIGTVKIDGNYYDIMVATHEAPVPAGETTIPSLLQVYLKETADNEQVEQLDGNDNGLYDILVVSQAVQTAGFETNPPLEDAGNAKAALNAAFDEVNAANVAKWLGGMDVPETVSTAAELAEALKDGGSVYLNADIDMGSSTLTITDDSVIDLNGYTINGMCNAGQGHMIMVNNGATLDIKDSSADGSGKITYAKGSSNTGWAIDLEGKLNLYSGTIELTGDSWAIGYAVDVRPNAWGTKYTEETVFHMYGGKLISSDGAVRVASSSSDSYTDIVASFIMDGGEIDAAYDGIFIQQSNTAYDTLKVEINNGSVTSDVYPVRFYAPVAETVNSGSDKPMTLKIAAGATVGVDGDFDTSKTWLKEGVVAVGGGAAVENIQQYSNISIG